MPSEETKLIEATLLTPLFLIVHQLAPLCNNTATTGNYFITVR